MANFQRIFKKTEGAVNVSMTMFFDRAHVVARLHKNERRAMIQIGAYARGAMKKMMRKSSSRTPHAAPGKPPRWSSKLLRDRIFFSYNPFRHSVIVGPEYKNIKGYMRPKGGKTIPQLLDEGGSASSEKHWVLKNRSTGKIASYNSLGAKRILRSKAYQAGKSQWHPMEMKSGRKKFLPRPYKGPTLAATLANPRLRSAWKIIS
jgi:hypothetical protein